MHREIGRDGLVDQIEELAELDRPMLGPGLMHDLTGRQAQRGEEIRDTVTLVIVGSPLDLAGSHRQRRLRPI